MVHLHLTLYIFIFGVYLNLQRYTNFNANFIEKKIWENMRNCVVQYVQNLHRTTHKFGVWVIVIKDNNIYEREI